MAARHLPERTCVGCRLQQPKRVLIRIVRTPAGSIEVDPTGKLSGRGAYLCRQLRCWNTGLRQSLARALKTTISDADRQALEDFATNLPEVDERQAPSGVSGRSTK